ncbi:phosphatase PAP2 family protein [Streptomyces sodiiphilus]|uniref:Phosphatase PAP2 family protein n=1 Tax=Streptomyces sodiiphilus TaxID=226217 RepID=A0ABN2PXK1_9ACTN
MAGMDNPDVDVLRRINRIADSLPDWSYGGVRLMGEFGFPLLLGLLVVLAWWSVRRRPDAPQAVAAVAWAPLAAVLAYLANSPIREFVARPRPFLDHDLHVMLDGKTGYSFVSDHATGAMVLAVALFLVHRRIGAIALVLALGQGFARVLMGLHYPTDVIGGYALGTAVVLLLSPAALAVLTPLARVCSRTRGLGWLVCPREEPAGPGPSGDGPGSSRGHGQEERADEPPAGPVPPGTGRHRARAKARDYAA